MLSRFDGSVDFNQNWAIYKSGFGSATGKHWLGNAYLNYLTNARSYKLRFQLEDWNGDTAYAEYFSFRVTSEADEYRLLLGDYTGSASADQNEDSTSGFLFHNNSRFSTPDNDNDSRSGACIDTYGYNGFWLQSCLHVGATNTYREFPDHVMRNSVRWDAWRVGRYSLKTMKMLMRPVT